LPCAERRSCAEQRRARFRKLDASSFADKKFDAVGCLEFLHLDRERGLADAENAGRRSEPAVFGDGMEGPKMAEYYCHNQ
jgi:hypothetical protein